MAASIAPETFANRASRLFFPWFGMGAAVGFWLWIFLTGADELHQVLTGLRRYLLLLPAGLAVSGVVCALLWFRGAWGIATRLSYVSGVFYFGFLKALGWGFVPWLLLVVAGAAFISSKDISISAPRSLLLLHVMGSMAGLYMAFHLGDFLRPWGLFVDVLQSLWLLMIDLIPG